jgi:hypothetical protein
VSFKRVFVLSTILSSLLFTRILQPGKSLNCSRDTMSDSHLPQSPPVPAPAVNTSPLTAVICGSTSATNKGAISAGCKMRRYGLLATKRGMYSLESPCVLRNGVNTSPAATAFTRIPLGASWMASDAMRCVIAALLAP